ncbi:MAG TPA: 16S rRNA (guanine(527)-N(7))-methyltransferase RsmG [Marmoricola sp.]|nr:16S rRNA (guanine(527)-N(7))-methyltransferase RsmG [Marmoricola sp.]
MFASALPTAEQYAELLATAGAERGLIGPREVPRLWDRHLLNCAVLTDLVPEGATVCDVGSGAGLPGLVMAIRRPELRVTLVEPLLRRTTFLEEAVGVLALSNVEVVRARADALHGSREFDVVTSRAVAALDKLVRWSLPLVRRGGLLLAMKGASAVEELAGAAAVLQKLGGVEPEVVHIGSDQLSVPTTVVRVEAAGAPPLGLASQRSTGSGRSRGQRKRR